MLKCNFISVIGYLSSDGLIKVKSKSRMGWPQELLIMRFEFTIMETSHLIVIERALDHPKGWVYFRETNITIGMNIPRILILVLPNPMTKACLITIISFGEFDRI